jgi:hypothetical protein
MKKLVLMAVLIQVFVAVNAKEVTGRVLDGYYAPDARAIHLVAVDLNNDGKYSTIDDVLITADFTSPVYTGFVQDVRYPKNSLVSFLDDNVQYVTRVNNEGVTETNREVSVRDVIAINRQSVLDGEYVSKYSLRQLELAFPYAYACHEQKRKIAAADKTLVDYYENTTAYNKIKAENERLKIEVTNRNLELANKDLESTTKALADENRDLRERLEQGFWYPQNPR